jgi:hypothetical protein
MPTPPQNTLNQLEMIKLLSPALKQLRDEDRKMLAAKSVNEADSSSGLNRVRRVLTALAIRDAAAASMELTNYRVPGRDRVAGAFTDRQALFSISDVCSTSPPVLRAFVGSIRWWERIGFPSWSTHTSNTVPSSSKARCASGSGLAFGAAFATFGSSWKIGRGSGRISGRDPSLISFGTVRDPEGAIT